MRCWRHLLGPSWASALRDNVDAGECKHVVLGLLHLFRRQDPRLIDWRTAVGDDENYVFAITL